MKAMLFALMAISAAMPAAAATGATSALLKQQTQALQDAVAPGDARVWRDYLDAQASYTDENGKLFDKTALLAQLVPLPKGISGHIEVTDWHATVTGAVAIATYVDDEHETYHGQHLHALYRATDTWIRRPAGWRLLASQILALQQDPPAVSLPGKLLDSYAGQYAAAANFVYDITRKGNALMGAVVGSKPLELKAETTDVFFTPGQPRIRKIFQRDAKGAVMGFVSRREGRDVVWKKIR